MGVSLVEERFLAVMKKHGLTEADMVRTTENEREAVVAARGLKSAYLEGIHLGLTLEEVRGRVFTQSTYYGLMGKVTYLVELLGQTEAETKIPASQGQDVVEIRTFLGRIGNFPFPADAEAWDVLFRIKLSKLTAVDHRVALKDVQYMNRFPRALGFAESLGATSVGDVVAAVTHQRPELPRPLVRSIGACMISHFSEGGTH